MRIAICDDEKCYIDTVSSFIKNWQIKNKVDTFSISTYTSSEDLLDYTIQDPPFDLVFLDIQFPGELDGLHLAHELRTKNNNLFIVFMTNYDEYAIEGYKVNALRYLQKPISDVHVFECLDIAYKQWKLSQDHSIIVECNQSLYKLQAKSILYIESKAHYLYIHSDTEKHELIIRNRLPDFMLALPPNIFIRCHRSFIVNILHIYSVSKKIVVLSNGESIPISDKYLKTLHSIFKSFYKGV